jgi:Cytochrome c oxidase subunit IV
VRLYARIALLLGGFLLVAGLVYGTTSHERRGLVLLLVAGAGFAYVGLYARRAVRAADRAAPKAAGAEPGAPEIAEPSGSVAPEPAASPQPQVEEVRPTIWPLVFSLAGAGIVAGVLASHWILLVGGVLAVAAAGGWFLEVLAQRQEHH